MHFDLNKPIDFLLQYAPPNILYRVKKEILHERTDTDEMISLQAQVLNLPKVKKAFSCQRENGFFGSVLHGGYFDGFDSTVDLLKRNGVELTDPHMIKARKSLIDWTDYEHDHFFKAGNAMDEHGRGGFRAIWAEQLVELGAEESLWQIQEQIEHALHAFEGALKHSTPDDFSKKATFRGKSCRYYIKGAAFPAANHIRILEKTLSWRSEQNLAMVRHSYAHCKEIMKDYHDGVIYVNCGYFVGPFNHHWTSPKRPVSIRDFREHPIDFAWFMKGLADASTVYPVFADDNPYLAESLYFMIEDTDFIDSISAEQLRMFKNYASIAPSWRNKESIACDLYFPLVLALSKASM